MTIRFAPARNRKRPGQVIIPSRRKSPALPAANDNGHDAANDDVVLENALRFFVEHGISAAERARDKAFEAHREGDGESYDWWLSVCRMLDRRMADGVAARTALAT